MTPANGTFEIGTALFVAGYSNVGILRGTLVGYTKGGKYRVKVNADSFAKAGEIVCSTWVSKIEG